MRFTVQRWLPCPPEPAFALLTHPESMSRWSLARVEGVEAGEGGHPSSIGATRFVHLPDSVLARDVRLEEVVCESRPPHRFVYRVVGGAPLAWHEGTQELERCVDPRGSGVQGSWLKWHVHAELATPVPGLASLVQRELEGGLRRSVEALVALIAEDPATEPLPRWTPPPEDPDPDALRRAHVEAETALRAIRRRRSGDPRTVFAGFYAEVLREVRARADAGVFTHPGWIHRLGPLAHEYYAEALRADDRGTPVEAHWREAFRAAERAFRTRRHLEATQATIAHGLRAHLDEDLPRILATTHRDHYPLAGFARFRADHLTMRGSFAQAQRRFVASLPADALSWRQRAARKVARASTALAWVPRARRQAFERGERLSALLGRAVRA
ncbi:MAG: hypothetical protein CMN30_17185 [Sandaracinus sp.]|nr:hypothetical protein [Sandaracinus sp.]